MTKMDLISSFFFMINNPKPFLDDTSFVTNIVNEMSMGISPWNLTSIPSREDPSLIHAQIFNFVEASVNFVYLAIFCVLANIFLFYFEFLIFRVLKRLSWQCQSMNFQGFHGQILYYY